MKESFFFAFLHRMKFIQRWGLMRNTQSENIKEHSFDVAVIAHNLASIKNQYFNGHVDANEVAVKALFHEVSEIFTGDMPTPIKYFTPQLRSLYGQVEALAQEKMLSTLPDKLQDDYRQLIVEAESSDVWPLVKAADTLAAFMKCVHEVEAGNEEFRQAHDSILKKLKDSHMPEVDMFLEIYIPSLGYSLDTLNYYDMHNKN